MPITYVHKDLYDDIVKRHQDVGHFIPKICEMNESFKSSVEEVMCY